MNNTVMTFSCMCSLSVLLSAVEMSHITQTTLDIPRIVAVATIRGQCLIVRLLFEGSDYLRVASI